MKRRDNIKRLKQLVKELRSKMPAVKVDKKEAKKAKKKKIVKKD